MLFTFFRSVYVDSESMFSELPIRITGSVSIGSVGT